MREQGLEHAPAYGALRIEGMTPDDYLSLANGPGQRIGAQRGIAVGIEDARLMCDQVEAWSVRNADGRLIAVLGILEHFRDQSGVVWAILDRPGRDHFALTRFARDRTAACPLPRLEGLALARDMDDVLAEGFVQSDLPEFAMFDPTPECRWMRMMGLDAVHVLRRYGAGDETYMLFERIRPRRPAATATALRMAAHG